MNLVFLKLKEIIQMIQQSKKGQIILVIILIAICSIILNFNNLLTSIMSIITNETEVKTVEFTSSGYKEKESGSFKITKHADWTSSDTAQITWTVKSYIERSSVNKDIIIVLDTSASMNDYTKDNKRNCTKLECAKNDIKELISEVLQDKENKISLIIFNDQASILSELTGDKTSLFESLDEIQAKGGTNYNQTLIKVAEVLVNYSKTEERQVEVLFITDGYPTIDNPNQNVRYEELKNKYPFITIHGIQYEMGEDIVDEIKKISDKQYSIDTNNLKNVLIESAFSPEAYEVFQIIDYIDNDYFTIESIDDITVDVGNIDLTTENNIQKVTWISDEILTGNEYQLKIKIKLNEKYVGVKGLYPTNKKEIVNIKLTGDKLNQYNTTEVPKLKAPYKIVYDANAPSGCSAAIDLTEESFAFDTVTLANEKLECDGYLFKGWEVEEEVTKVNDNSFIMPTEDVVVRGIWTKLELNKTMEGTVYEKLSLYNTIAKQAVPDNIKSKYVVSLTGINFGQNASDTNGKGVYTVASTLNDKYPIHYFRGDIDNNHVLFANYCWKIIRTTETGGVKLIYDGIPVDGVCDNTGEDTQIGKSAFSTSIGSIEGAGYMYNTHFVLNNQIFTQKAFRTIGLSKNDYYYSKEQPIYDKETNKYTLVSADHYTLESNSEELAKGGYYTCLSSTSTTCKYLFYIIGTSNTNGIFIEMSGGKFLEDVNDMIMSDTIKKNGDGTYTLSNPIVVKCTDWLDNYKNYKHYYMCSDMKNTTCDSIKRITLVNYNHFYYYNSSDNYAYGNSFTYDTETSTYTLIDTEDYPLINFWDFHDNYQLVKNYRYTCLNDSGKCKDIYYIIAVDNGDKFKFLKINGGYDVTGALNEMLHASDVNKNDSPIKKYVDSWYKENMTDYTKYIENTIYCNDRSIYVLNGYDPNSGIIDYVSNASYYDADDLRYGAFGRKENGSPILKCPSKIDSFTLSVESGGQDGYGNNALTYPVGLITVDEVMYAAGNRNNGNFLNYLNNGVDYWTMSPRSNDLYSTLWIIDQRQLLKSNIASWSSGVRPVISLKPDIEYSSGDGSSQTPYVIDLTSIE